MRWSLQRKKSNVSVSILELNWEEKSHIVYIGKAGGIDSKSTLKCRLTEYLNFGQGKPVGHLGGRFIWQLKNSKELIVAWKTLDDKEPRNSCILCNDFSISSHTLL